jgi:DNA-binding NarL/FixJ family response regulator
VNKGETVFSSEVSMSLAGKVVEKNSNGVEVELTEREIEILTLDFRRTEQQTGGR